MNRFELLHLGWDESWEEKIKNLDIGSLVGRINRVERGECDILTADGQIRAQSDSQRSQDDIAPVTGDWVIIAKTGDEWAIETILPRRTELVRKDPGERETQQPLSANVDFVFLVHGFDRPFRAGKLERFLVLAWNADATPVVVLTKEDLASEGERDELVGLIEAVAPGVEVIVSSVVSGTGIDRIAELLQPHLSGTMLGESGAGKSSLVNALLGVETQDTAEVRRSDAKGRHTTITRDLLVLDSGGVLIDTPGIRAVGLWDARDALEKVFSDVTGAAEDCKFGDCAHDGEPQCAVKRAVEAGEIDVRRLERFRIMTEELEESEQRLVERSRSNNERSRSSKRSRRKR